MSNMKVRIYKPTKSTMQSGKARTKKWVVEPIEEKNLRHLNPLMNWVSVDNTLSELRFEFLNKEDAIAFAKKSHFDFIVEEPRKSSFKKKAYADNFL